MVKSTTGCYNKLMNSEILNQSIEVFIKENPKLVFLALAWTLIWKGFALWRSAKEGQKIWFTAILIVNTLGILEMIYLGYVYLKNRKEN